MFRNLIIVVLMIIVALPIAAKDDAPQAKNSTSGISFNASDELKKSGFPFSSAVETDGWVFLSGSLGTIPGEGLVAGGIKPETQQTMENIKGLLASMGLGMERIVKCTVMLADMAEWSTFNEVYKNFFESNYPARSAFGASGLALNARVEIECIAKR